MLGFGLLPAAGELLLEGLLFFLLDRLGGKLLERLSHHIHIPAFEEDEIARRLLRGVFLERVVDPVLVRCALERLDVSVGHFNVADCGVLLDKVLDGLLAPVGLGLRGLLFGLFNFLNEFGERLFQHFRSDPAALNGNRNDFGIYFILHGDLLSEICGAIPSLRRDTV